MSSRGKSTLGENDLKLRADPIPIVMDVLRLRPSERVMHHAELVRDAFCAVQLSVCARRDVIISGGTWRVSIEEGSVECVHVRVGS